MTLSSHFTHLISSPLGVMKRSGAIQPWLTGFTPPQNALLLSSISSRTMRELEDELFVGLKQREGGIIPHHPSMKIALLSIVPSAYLSQCSMRRQGVFRLSRRMKNWERSGLHMGKQGGYGMQWFISVMLISATAPKGTQAMTEVRSHIKTPTHHFFLFYRDHIFFFSIINVDWKTCSSQQ